MSEKDELRNRRKRFCYLYAVLGDPEEAAVRAGYSRDEALGAAMELLKSSCNDAVQLAFSDELPPQDVLGRLDLYNVSEIKRVRGGGVEVKVFDRIRALEKLYELENALTESGRAEALIRALTSDGEEDGAEC